MSTTQSSAEGKVLMLDPPDMIMRKFKRAVTDSGSEIVARDDKPGVSNLLDILSAITGSDVPDARGGLRRQGLRRAEDRCRRGRDRGSGADPDALRRADRRSRGARPAPPARSRASSRDGRAGARRGARPGRTRQLMTQRRRSSGAEQRPLLRVRLRVGLGVVGRRRRELVAYQRRDAGADHGRAVRLSLDALRAPSLGAEQVAERAGLPVGQERVLALPGAVERVVDVDVAARLVGRNALAASTSCRTPACRGTGSRPRDARACRGSPSRSAPAGSPMSPVQCEM